MILFLYSLERGTLSAMTQKLIVEGPWSEVIAILLLTLEVDPPVMGLVMIEFVARILYRFSCSKMRKKIEDGNEDVINTDMQLCEGKGRFGIHAREKYSSGGYGSQSG